MTTNDSTAGTKNLPATTDAADDETGPEGEQNEPGPRAVSSTQDCGTEVQHNERMVTARTTFRDVGFIENHNERLV